MKALDLYHHFVAVIDRAFDDRDIYAVSIAAETAGMSGGEERRGMGQRWNYHFTDGNDQTIEVHARWWDQSQAFSIQPDMHVMSVELKTLVPPMRYERRFEE